MRLNLVEETLTLTDIIWTPQINRFTEAKYVEHSASILFISMTCATIAFKRGFFVVVIYLQLS